MEVTTRQVAATGDEEPLGPLRPGPRGKWPERAYWLLMVSALVAGGFVGARLAGGVWAWSSGSPCGSSS